MAGFGLMVLAQASFRFIYPEVPDFPLMGIIGGLALMANATCLWLLIRHRNYDLNMRSTWLCSRNDIVANLGALSATTAVIFHRLHLARPGRKPLDYRGIRQIRDCRDPSSINRIETFTSG